MNSTLMETKRFTTVDEYINHFPENCKVKLQEIRKIIGSILPEATEIISYQIPAYKINGFVIYFAGFAKHISLYPAPREIQGFEELNQFKGGKGTVQFPLDKDLPLELITKIVNFRKQEDSKKIKS
ncbi:iron chaperone [Flavobacterium sp. H122]|uniref:iron chaperone n=1 Tax=Flavobacterium sp. H122 TaxID=2529860 RepID=UPI0010AA2C42|nr:DUF1801 domain-containing protein [Flavobacterium sp. H122]